MSCKSIILYLLFYVYRVDTDSSLAGASEDSAKTTLQTSVNIEVLSPCEFVLHLTNTKLTHSTSNGAMKTADRENEFRSEVEASPLRFSFQNGAVEHVCAETQETVRSLNFKKGILSALQNNMDDLTQNQNVTETDVAGMCKTSYKLVSNGYYTIEVKKVKDILSCTDRLDYLTMLQQTTYKVPSDLQNLPIMKTTSECVQDVESGGVLKSAVCTESHVYRPFANGESGARTSIKQTLTYQTYRSGVSTRSGNVKSRSSLLFDHSANHPTLEQARTAVEQKLSEICDSTAMDVRPETPRLFTELVAAMKGLGKQDMTDLHRLLKTKTMCPANGRTYKYFHDALPMVSTSASVSLMSELINDKDATGLEASAWLTSFAFIRFPTSEMLLSAKTLLDNKAIPNGAMLPVSSMVNNFCKMTDTCDQDSTVLSIISSLERNIDYNCDASGKKFELTLLTLKAIGNAGNSIRAAPVLNKCLRTASNPLEIRVAAAEAFRRMPCTVEDKHLWNTLTDKDLDSELRINSYLALMRCPTEATLSKIATILNTEEDEQVGAFVYSHLTNLRETSDPHKQDVAQAINNLALDKEFDMSPLKYSRNFEVSALINKLNTGVTAESNLIWSNKAQLPRAVSGNLTVELFGQSINLLDFGGRLEGLEYLIKNIFGPYVNSKKDSSSKIDSESVKGSVYGRVFGNEMMFMHSQTTKSLFGEKMPTWLEVLIKMAKQQHIALTQTVQFMDVCMVIPSSAGLPVHMRVNGTTTVDLNLSGKMDLRKVGASPRSMDIDGEVRPSAALEITGSLFVDSFGTKTGIRMRNTMHTSTAMKGRIQLTRGQQLNVEFDTPEDKMEIFDARSKFFVLHDDMEKEQKMIKENRKEYKVCSSQRVTEITGMELCGELSFPNASMKADSPYFPMTGPTSVSVALFKKDSHSGYKLFAKTVQNKKASYAQISVNTPGSQIDRAISLDMSLNYKKQHADLSLASPWKKLSLTGNMINQKELKSLSGSLVVDDKDTYALTGEVKIAQSKSKIQVTPMLEIRRPGANNVLVTGLFSMEKPMKSANLEMSLSGVSKLPYTVKAVLINNKKEKSVEASISFDGKKEYSVKASNKMNIMGKKSVIAVIEHLLEVQSPAKKLVTFSSNINYREDKSLKHTSSIYIYRITKRPATLKVNLLKIARKKANNYKGILKLKSSPISGNIICSIARKPNGFTSVISKVDYSIPKVARNTINLSGKFNDRSTKAYKSYILQSTVAVKKNPELNTNMKIEVGHKKKLSHVSIDAKYGANPKDKTKRVYFLASLNRKIANLKNAVLNYKLKAQAPAHDIDISLQGKHQHSPKLLDSNVQLSYAPKKDINAEITLRDRSTKLAKINGKASLSWPGTEYILSSDLSQKSGKQYSHDLSFKSNSGARHTLSTIYKMPKADSHAVVTSLRLHKMKPIVVSGSTSLNLKNFAASGDVKTGQDVYGFNTMYKFSKAPSGKFSLELIHPARRMTLDMNGGKTRSKYEGTVEAAWDADSKDSRVILDGSYFHKAARGSVSLAGDVNFRSPFTNFENLVGSVKYGSDDTQHSANGKLLWGQKKIMSSLTAKKPINLNNIQVIGNIKTPFSGFRNADLDIAHSFDKQLSSVVKGNLDKKSAMLSFEGNSIEDGHKGKIEASLNKDKVILDGSYFNKAATGLVNLGGDINLRSPFTDNLSLIGSLNLASDDAKHSANGKLAWGGKKNQIISSVTVKKPVSFNNFQVNGNIKTPFRGFRNADLDISHSFDDLLSTVVKGNLEKESASVQIQGKNLRNGFKGSMDIKTPFKGFSKADLDIVHKFNDGSLSTALKGNLEKESASLQVQGQSLRNGFKGNMDLKSTIKNAEAVALSVSHTSTDAKSESSAKVNHNGKVYAYDLDMTHSGFGLQRETVGDLVLTMNKKKVATHWDHKNTEDSVKSLLSSKWGNQRFLVDLTGSHKLSDLRNINGVLKIKSPWKPVRDVEFNIDHKHGEGLIDHVAFFKQGQHKEASSMVNYKRGQNNVDFDFNLESPFHEELSGKLNTNYDNYPMTTSAELKWAPKMKGTVEGSLNLESWDNADLNMKMTTPSRTLNNVVVKASNKKQAGELVSHFNFNYGLRQNIDIESRIANGDKKMIRFKMTTPFKNMKALETGLNLNGDVRKFDASIDFEILPILGKYDGAMNWQYDDVMIGKLRIDTPLPEYPYFEMSTSSMMNGRTRKSHIQAEYYPSQVYSLDAVYVFELPLSMDVTLRSPHPAFDDIGLSLKHNMDGTSIKSNGIVRYQSDKNIEAELNADWASYMEGNVVVKTPFSGYETNKITLRHRGQLNDFDSHGEIDVAQQNIVADASFKSGYTTTGTFTFTSPIPGLEKIDASIKKKGNMKGLRGSGIVRINDDKFQLNFNNRMAKDSLKSGFNLKTPYSDPIKFALDHSGPVESFTNKINLNYGRDIDIDTIATFDLRGNDVNGKGILKYKLTNSRNTARLSFSKSGTIEDLSFMATSGLNRDQISVSGSFKTMNGLEGTLAIKTPFDNFKNTGLELSHTGDMSAFTSSAKINYMDNKNIDGKLEFSNIGGNGMKLTSELTTPFKTFESTSLKFNHEISGYSGDIAGTVELTTTIGGFGSGDISYSRTGDIENLVLKCSASAKGKDLVFFKLTNSMQDTEVHSTCNFKSAITPDVLLTIDHSGDSFSLNTKTMGKVGKNMVSTITSMKRSYNKINADSSIMYRIQGLGKSTASVSLNKNGDLENFNVELTGKFDDKMAKLTASKSGILNNMHFGGSATYNQDSIDITGGWRNTDDIEGSLKVVTPFKDFRNTELALTHRGDLSDFASSFNMNFMNGESIIGKVELTANNLENIKFISEMTTPIKGFESLHMKFNNKYDIFTSDLNGAAAIDTSICNFGYASTAYTKTGRLDNLELTGNVMRNGVEVADLSIKNNLQGQELHSSFECKSSLTPDVKVTVDHNGDLTNLKTSAKAFLGQRNIISGEASLNQRGDIIDGEGKVMYTIEDFGSNQASLNVHKAGGADKINVVLTGKYAGKMAKITGNFKNENELTGDLSLNTPIKGYKNVGLSFKHSGNLERFNCEGKVMFTDGEEYSGKIGFYHYLTQRIESVIELNTPISGFEYTKYEYRHEGQSDSFTCSSSLQYGNSNRINYEMSAKSSPMPEFTSTLKVDDIQVMLVSGSYENTWPKYGFNGKYAIGKDSPFSIDGSLDLADDIVGALTASSPLKGFSNVGLNFQHSKKSNGINTEGKVTYMDGKVISAKADATMSNRATQASVELTTPFQGYELFKYDSKVMFNRRITKVLNTVVYGNNKKIVMDAYTKFKPSPEVSLTISSPLSEDIVAFVSVDNSWPKYELVCKLSPGNGDQFTLDGAFDATSDISGSLKITTPYEDFTKVGMNFLHSGNDEKFGSEGTLTYMDNKEIFGKVNFYRYMWSRMDASLELTTPFAGMEDTKAEVNFEDKSNGISTTAALQYNKGEKLNGNVKITYSPNYEVTVTMNTPSNVVKAQGALDLTAPTYEALCSLNYGNDQAYSMDGKFSLFSIEHMEGFLEVNTPFIGLESTKAEYNHKVDSSDVEGSISLAYDNGKKMSCEVKSTISPNFDGTVTVKTPFTGYENMQAAANFDSSYKKYQTSSSLNLGQKGVFSMSSELDYSIEPIKASTKIVTPFRNFRNVELEITHEGGLTNFKTTGFLSSPITDHVNAKASLRYDTPMDMAVSASLQSSIKGYDDLKVELKTSELAGEMKTNALVGWTSGEQIAYDGLFTTQQGWNEDKMHADVSISTPFVAIQNMNLQMDHSAQTDRFAEKMNFELNGDSLLDFDAEYKFNDKQSAEIDVRQPWPMQYTASKSSSDGIVETEVFANWNRDELDSNVRLQGSVSDKSNSYQTENTVDLSCTYASRKVGVVHKLSDKSSELMSNGYIYWNADDDSKVSYELQFNDNSRRNKQMLDGSFKLGLPSRTLGLTGSMSKNAASLSTDTTFSWDADRDDTKQVGVKAIINHSDRLKGDITLSMPSMRKKIRVNGEVMLNNGRVILDTQTDISYSKDSRKTLTLTSKLEDISTGYNNFNYSLALGVKHPHTNIDIEMNSHLGSSDKKMTLGVATNYLTSQRQMKNFALLSEINMLKKKISVQMVNPMNKMEIVGDIVSETPYKMRLLNKIDDVEAFRSDMIIDAQKKSFHFNTFTDSNIWSFTAKYPNMTAFRADFTRHTPSYDQEEALLAVRLNSSRLMHTRLSWRPDMMQDLKDYMGPIAAEQAKIAVIGLADMNKAFAEEISSKYSAISTEMNRELRPFISALNEELAIVADKMTELSYQLREMYNRNDFYIQNMGDGVLRLQEKLQELSRQYRATYTNIISSWKSKLSEIRRYPIKAYYTQFMTENAEWLMRQSMESAASLEKYMAEVDIALKEYKASMQQIKQKAMNTIYNATYVDYMAKKISQVKNVDISPYISSFDIPQEYSNAIYSMPSTISDKLNNALEGTKLKEGLNEAYQQGLWAYNYWQMDENLEKHARSILKTLQEIVEDELKEYSEDFKVLLKSPITVWDPNHGEIQADLPLPIALKRLDELLDMTPLMEKAEKFLVAHLPDQGTWDSLVKSVSDLMPAKPKTNKGDDLQEQLTKLKPSKKYRKKKGRKYKVKKSRK